MKKIIILSTIFLLWAIPVLGANTHSIDLERGESDYLWAANHASLDITGDISVEAWVKVEDDPDAGDLMYTITSHNNAADTEYAIWWAVSGAHDDPNVGLTATYWSNYGVTSGTTHTHDLDIEIGVWHHVAMTIDVSVPDIKFYYDGTQTDDSGTAGATAIESMSGKTNIGRMTAAGTRCFDGKIDDVRYWNDVRTQTEIDDNKSKELVGNEAGLVAYWKLNNSGTDDSSNSNTMTNSGGTYDTDPAFVGVTDTCTCPTDGTDWYVESDDVCYLATNCDLDGKGLYLLWQESGSFNIIDGAELSVSKIESTSTPINVKAGGQINFK